MSPTTRIAQALLITHGLMNISQGIYSLVSPQEYAALAGDMFAGAPDKALKSIGLGAIGVGWYELIFAYQYNRALILATIPMRLVFAGVISSWGSRVAVAYELVVALVCGMALLV